MADPVPTGPTGRDYTAEGTGAPPRVRVQEEVHEEVRSGARADSQRAGPKV